MLDRTAAFDKAITNGGISVVECAIQRHGATIAMLDLLPGAVISFDDTAESWASFQGQVANTGIAPHLAGDTLYPTDIEAVISTGMITPAAPQGEMLQLGVFRVNMVQDDTTGLISIQGPDRAFVIANALNESPYAIAAGTPLDVAIGSYLAAKYPSLVFVPDGAAHSLTLASTVVFQAGTASGDPWQNMQDLATDFGRELFMDNLGRAVLQPVPDPATVPPCWNYSPGSANLAISGTHTIDTSQNVYNAAVVSSAGTGVATPVSATYEITDVTSPIYPDPAGFGRRPLFYSSSQLLTEEDCLTAATALINKQPGSFDQITMTAIPHPAHRPDDIVFYSSNLLGLALPLQLASWSLQVDLLAPTVYTTRTAGAVAEQVLQDFLNLNL